jgi:type IV secretory pathway VirB10-like protein
MADEKPRAKRSTKIAGKKARAKKSAKKENANESAAATRVAKAKSVVVKKASARKPVSIKKARVGKRAVLPPLPPPPTVSLKAARSPARRASRVKALLRNKGAVKTNLGACEAALCTEAALREKLRIAAPYLEIWLTRRDREKPDVLTPEAAFVRIWQWLTLRVMLDDRRVMTADLIEALFTEELGGERGGR